MKRFDTLTLAICAVLLLIGGLTAPASAQPYRHRARYVYADTNANYYPACRVGWWQTVVYGHVRPHWAVWCR